MTRLFPASLLVAGLAISATAQPSEISSFLNSAGAPDSADGDMPVRSWVLRGADFTGFEGWARACAPAENVGSAPEGDSASGAAFGPDGSWFVLAHRDSRNLLVYDADTRDLIREIPLSGSPIDLAVSSDGRWAVTPNLFEDTASIVDLDTGAEVAVLPIGDAPIMVRITPDGSTALVGSMVAGEIAVIDIDSATVLRTIGGLDYAVTLAANFETFAVTFTCANPFELAGGSTAIFPDMFNDQIGFVDIDAGTVEFLPTDDSPRGVAVTPDGATAVVTHSFGSDDTLGVIDVASQTITKTISVPTDLWGPVALSPDGAKAAIGVQNAVRVVNIATGAVSSDINTASVNALITTADGQYALGVGFRGSLVSYADEDLVKNLNNFVSTSVGAVSPADPRAVMVATTFGEDMVVANTDGASGFLEETLGSGPAPEGDKPRTLGISSAGDYVVTSNQFSQNATVFSGAMNQLGLVDAGRRPGEVEVARDGSVAVVANRDDTFVTVVDLASLTGTDVPISTRGDQVEISPDGAYAYIAVVVSDGVWRVNLDTMAVDGPKLVTGNMGGVGYTGNQFSGMSLSPDGTTLVTCDSFSDSISIIDTASWSVVATVPTAAFPTAAAFSPNSGLIFVTCRDSDSIAVVENAGAGSAVIGTVAVGDNAFEGVASADGQTYYVMLTADAEIGVVDVPSLTMVDTIPLDMTPVGVALDEAGDRLLVGMGTATASTDGTMTQAGQLAIIDTTTNTVAETICADHFMSDLAVDAGADLAAGAGLGGESAIFFDIGVCPQDINNDGVVNTQDVIQFLNLWSSQDPIADWDANGTVDTRDFLAFLNDWVAGC